MAGRVPVTHVFAVPATETWVPGIPPGMTVGTEAPRLPNHGAIENPPTRFDSPPELVIDNT